MFAARKAKPFDTYQIRFIIVLLSLFNRKIDAISCYIREESCFVLMCYLANLCENFQWLIKTEACDVRRFYTSAFRRFKCARIYLFRSVYSNQLVPSTTWKDSFSLQAHISSKNVQVSP